MKALLLALLLGGVAAAQSFTVAVDWDGGPLAVGVQVLGIDIVDEGGVRVAPAVQVHASTAGTLRAYTGAVLFYTPAGARYAWSARALLRVAYEGGRVPAGPSFGVVWTWRP